MRFDERVYTVYSKRSLCIWVALAKGGGVYCDVSMHE